MIKKILSNTELLLVSFSQISQLFGAVLFTKLLTVYLTKDSYGYYSLSMSLVAIITMLPYKALNEGLGRFISIYNEEEKLPELLSNIGILYFLFYIPYLLISFVAYFYIDNDWKEILVVLNFYVFFEIFKVTAKKIENNIRNRKFVAKTTIIELVIKITLTFIIAKSFTLKVATIFEILLISNVVVVVWSYLKRKNYYKFIYIKKGNSIKLLRRLTSFSWPLLVWSIFGWFLTMANRWLLDFFLDKEAVADFSLTSSIALLPSTAVAGILGAFLLPIIYEKANTDIYYPWKIIKKTIFFQVIFYLVLIAVFIFLGAFIIEVLSSEKYVNSAWMLPYLIVGSGCFAIGQVLTYEIFALKETKQLLMSTIIPGIWSVFAGYFLIKYFGIKGAVINFTSTYLIYLLLTIFTTLKFHLQLLAKKIIK